MKEKIKIAGLVLAAVMVGIGALYGLLKPVPGGCIMTYMYPTYIPIAAPANFSSDKYGLYLYHEGWKQIDFAEHIKNLDGVPVLFIPGNGGSYKQVRSLAAESSRAYDGGPLELTYYQEALLRDADEFSLPNHYNRKLNWFAVDLEGEHSAMDGRILKEHTEYVVYAIHRILDQYRESHEARSNGPKVSQSLPTSVVLVGHSMGGFVARAALVHPHLRKSAVETILTLSTPHQTPPIALQPSLGHYYAQVNEKWRKGYEATFSPTGLLTSNPQLSHVIVVSVSGGVYDYQVRSKLASLDGIVPSTHGFMIGSTGMKNVWLSMDHQSILWCNQLVVQVSHTLLSLVNPGTGQPFSNECRRLLVFAKMLQSGLPQSINLMKHVQLLESSEDAHVKNSHDAIGSKEQGRYSCPTSVYWEDFGLEKDLYVQSSSVTILAMDGRRRWLDIKKLGSGGRGHFILVTNLAPCYGIRLHLWPDKDTSDKNVSPHKRILDVTSKMVRIPSGPAPRQIEPGSQSEQAPPSAVIQLNPEEMRGYRFLTISVAPRPTVSGRPPPAISMAVGQFYNPEEGRREIQSTSLLWSAYFEQDMVISEDHPLALDMSFPVSLGLLPIRLSLRTLGCGLQATEQAQNMDVSSLCKLRCFPPVALAWDSTSGLHIIPNMQNETVIIDSSPALWDSDAGSDRSTVLLLVDPHCSYQVSFAVSIVASAARFCLLYSPQIIGFMIAVCFFGLMRQERAWELDMAIPSILTAIELNLRLPVPSLLLAAIPTVFSLLYSSLTRGKLPPVASFISVTTACYLIANGTLIIIILTTRLGLYIAAVGYVLVKKRWQSWVENLHMNFFRQVVSLSSVFYSFKVVRILKGSPNLVIASLSVPLVIFVHPSLGLVLLLVYHIFCCHLALTSFLAASFRGHAQESNEYYVSSTNPDPSVSYRAKSGDVHSTCLPVDDSTSGSPNTAKSFHDSQLEIFNYQHGMLILHLIGTLMFIPSLVAWMQRIGMGQSFPSFIDSTLCIGIILHGLYGSKLDTNCASFTILGSCGQEFGLSLPYLLLGYYSFLCSIFLAPYRAFYAMGASGAICLLCKFISRRQNVKSGRYFRRQRRHSHKH